MFFYIEPQALYNTKRFLHEQIFASLSGNRMEGRHSLGCFFIIHTYFRYYGRVFIVGIIIIAIASKMESTNFRDNLFSGIKNKYFILFISLSIISSWPIAISLKQFKHYAMQSAPFFTLAMMQLCFDSYQVILKYCISRMQLMKAVVYSSSLLFIISLLIVINFAGGYNKHKNIIQDIQYLYLQNHVLPKNGLLSIPRDISSRVKADPHVYFQRYAGVSLTHDLQDYYLTAKG